MWPVAIGERIANPSAPPRVEEALISAGAKHPPITADAVCKMPGTMTTEISLVTGDRYRVQGDIKDIERIIIDAARGSIMQLAWFVEADTGAHLAVNPAHVVTLRAVGS